MALDTVADYISEARTLLQDTTVEYRYADDDIVGGMNLGFLEARRLRSDLFLAAPATIPSYSAASPATAVAMDVQYRTALLYYAVGQVTLQDQEEAQDQRAAMYMNMFVAKLMSVTS